MRAFLAMALAVALGGCASVDDAYWGDDHGYRSYGYGNFGYGGYVPYGYDAYGGPIYVVPPFGWGSTLYYHGDRDHRHGGHWRRGDRGGSDGARDRGAGDGRDHGDRHDGDRLDGRDRDSDRPPRGTGTFFDNEPGNEPGNFPFRGGGTGFGGREPGNEAGMGTSRPGRR